MNYFLFISKHQTVWLFILFFFLLVQTNMYSQCVTTKLISSEHGNLQAPLLGQARFGNTMASLGDLDGDGIMDVAVGASGEDRPGGSEQGVVYILFMNADETVKAEQEISTFDGGLISSIDSEDGFGTTLANIGDLDGDGINELAVTVLNNSSTGSVIILFLNSDGTVRAEQRIGQNMGGFIGTLDALDGFGKGLAGLGDLDGDGVPDIAVGASDVTTPQNYKGGVYILYMNTNGTVKSQTLITEGTNGLNLILPNFSNLGVTLANIGDFDGDGVNDLAVSQPFKPGGGIARGAVYIWLLNSDGTIKSEQEIGDNVGGFPTLGDEEKFGSGLVSAGDIDGDGVTDLFVGAQNGDFGGQFGRAYLLLLNADGTVKAHQEISNEEGDLSIPIPPGTNFGGAVTNLGDIDNDGYINFMIGAPRDYTIGTFQGLTYLIDLKYEDGAIILQNECPASVVNQISSVGATACLNSDLPVISNGVFDLVSMAGSSTFDGAETVEVQWQISYDNISWEDIPSASSLDLLSSIEFTQTTYIRRAFFGVCCSIESYSNVITITQGGTSPEIASIIPLVYCPNAGESTQIMVDVMGGTSPYTYSWEPSLGLSDPTIEDPIITFGLNDVYEITVTGADGCVAKKNAVMVPIQADAGGATTYICNDNVEIGSNGIVGASGITYSWSPTTNLSCSDCPNPIADPSSNTTYTLTIDDGNGCTNSASIDVILGAYTANAGDDVYLCRGETAIIGTPEQAGIFYGWAPGFYIDSQTIAQPTFFSGIIPAPNPFTYTLTTFDPVSGDCSSIDTLVTHVVVANTGIPEPNLFVCNSPKRIGTGDCCDGEATYEWTILSGDMNSFYDESTGTFSSTSSFHSPFVFPSSPTKYQLRVTWGPNADNSGGAECIDMGIVAPNCNGGCGIFISFQNDVNCSIGLMGTTINTDIVDDFNTITWSPTTNLSCSDCPNPTLLADVATNITYTVSITNTLDNSVCSETFTVYASTTSLPSPLVQSGSVCVGVGFNLGNLPVAGWSYEWSPAVSLDDGASSNPLATPLETTIYTLSTTDDITGCVTDTSVIVAIFNKAGSAGGDKIACTGGTVVLGTPSEAGLTYFWSPSIDLSDPNIAQPTVTANITRTYTLLVTAANGCTYSEDILVTATNALNIITGDINFCEGTSATLFANVTGINPNLLSYSWTGPGLTNANTSKPTVTGITTDQTYTVDVQYNGMACGSATEDVIIRPLPTANLSDVTICNSPVLLRDPPPPFVSGITYWWTPADGLDQQNLSSPTASPAVTTTYNLKITDRYSCVDNFSMIVTVDGPEVNAGMDLEICEGSSISLGALAAEAGASYTWSPVDFLVNPNSAQTIATPSITTTYTLTGTKNGCTSTDEITITVTPKPTNTGELDPFVVLCQDMCEVIGVENNSLYTYSWLPASKVSNPNMSMTEICPSEDVDLSLIITDPITGCGVTKDISIYTSTGGNCEPCSIDTSVFVVTCNNNGTPADVNDDTFVYSINTTSTGGTTYSISGSDNQSGLDYGVENGPYGPFNISDGNLNLMIIDEVNNSCQQAIIINAPSPCSVCPVRVCMPIIVVSGLPLNHPDHPNN